MVPGIRAERAGDGSMASGDKMPNLRDAAETDPRAADSIPSTKGTLGG